MALSKTPFDPVRDFAAISLLAIGANVIATHPSFPARNIKELVELAKKQPGKLTFGSTGVGLQPSSYGRTPQADHQNRHRARAVQRQCGSHHDLLSGQ